jgi:hypothetical protein
MTKTKWYQKPIYLMVALALVLVLAVGLPLTVAASGTSVTVGSAELEVGQTANISVTVYFVESAGTGAYALEVGFTPGVIEVLDVLSGDAPFDTVMAWNINNTAGWVKFATVQATQIPGPTGSFVIAYLPVKAIGEPGTETDLTLTKYELVDANGDPVEATPINGQVTIKTATPSATDGEASLVKKLAGVAPWIILGAAVIVGASLVVLRRRRARDK